MVVSSSTGASWAARGWSRGAFTLLLAVVVGAVVFSPSANASHDRPLRSSGIRVGLVRAYAPCEVPNAVHDQVLVIGNACAPATALSPFKFGPKGQARAQIKTLPDGLQMKFKLVDVRDASDALVDLTFHGRITIRITDHGCSAATSCTFESAVQIDVPCDNGRCVGSQVYPAAFLPVGLEGSAEVVQVDVTDPNGDRFATTGVLLP
jgi:hypothetical protein